ncbi:hypothetical protein Q75_15440 [Bacillus coahuilensis p1.1.43]|uniref:NlpC/P60 domain-containing protein n=2 Tax=Bacillus coahuilensis TaxID=408580 RepID=A0A147K4S9_9BACI|nr:hypothetical protein Q75_15440 [Bacillus coahuilensis p1.1.43]
MFTSVDTAEASSSTFDINRISGDNRYETSVEVSRQAFKSANTVVIAVGNNFPDALAGASLAYKENAPILLTDKTKLPSQVKSEISRLGAKNAYILGGTAVISPEVEKQLSSLGLNVTRIAGKDRFDTAVKIADIVGGKEAVVAYGGNFPDSLSIASYAGSNGSPILLVDNNSISSTTKEMLEDYQTTTVVGGTKVVGESVVNNLNNATRVAGSNRYDTSVKIADKYFGNSDEAILATGQAFADALTGSILAANKGVPVLLVESDSVPKEVMSYIEKKSIDDVTIIGGNNTVSKDVEAQLRGEEPKVVETSKAQIIVEEAKKYMGVRYVYGGTTPSGFDCSGYIGYVFKQHGISLPRTTSGLNTLPKVSNPKPGDILLFNTSGSGVSHAGIFLGNDQFIHSGSSTGVAISSLSNSYWGPRYMHAVTPFK